MTALVHRRAARWIIDDLVDDGADGGDVNECRTRRLSWPIVKQRRREASDVGEWNEQCRLCYRYETESSTTGNHRHATRSVTLLLRFLPLDRQGYPSTTGGWPRNPVRNSTTSNSTIFVVFFFFFFFFANCVLCRVRVSMFAVSDAGLLVTRHCKRIGPWPIVWLISCAQSTSHLPPHLSAVGTGKMKRNTL